MHRAQYDQDGYAVMPLHPPPPVYPTEEYYYYHPPPPPRLSDNTNVLLLLLFLVFLCMVALAVGLAQMGRIERSMDTLVHLQYSQQHVPWWNDYQW